MPYVKKMQDDNMTRPCMNKYCCNRKNCMIENHRSDTRFTSSLISMHVTYFHWIMNYILYGMTDPWWVFFYLDFSSWCLIILDYSIADSPNPLNDVLGAIEGNLTFGYGISYVLISSLLMGGIHFVSILLKVKVLYTTVITNTMFRNVVVSSVDHHILCK